MKTCPNCHHPVEETQKFCANCAASLTDTSASGSGWKNPPAVAAQKQPAILSGTWNMPKTPGILTAVMALFATAGVFLFGGFLGNNRLYSLLISLINSQTMLLLIGLFVIAFGLGILLLAIRILRSPAAGLLKACSLGTGALFTVSGIYLLFLCIRYREIFEYARFGREQTMALVYYIPDFLFILSFGMLGVLLLSLILGGKHTKVGRILAMVALLADGIAIMTLLYKVMSMMSTLNGVVFRAAVNASYMSTLPISLILFAVTMCVFACSSQKTEE